MNVNGCLRLQSLGEIIGDVISGVINESHAPMAGSLILTPEASNKVSAPNQAPRLFLTDYINVVKF
jgi:hypothetical protein